ncbi:hypothetical protein GCM10009821_00060 [Aeromicrobium halocynthiae]|uniref:DUF4384 domain-containing protein n=1 Tax=Aeromicrobium halocynthiae TaxID=560557 RepID=A0ABN2VTI5_9ACTN
MLRIEWSVRTGPEGGTSAGTEQVAPGGKLVVARRMTLPPARPVLVERLDGSVYVFVALPYVSDPALVITATDGQPVLYRGQRANGAVVELVAPRGPASSPEPGQRVSVTQPGTRVDLRFPDLTVSVTIDFDRPQAAPAGSGTEQLGVTALEGDDLWLVGALAVALSPEHGVVAHGDLKAAFARWRGVPEPSAGTFDRTIMRPALEQRGIELPGPRLNKIVYLVEWSRRTSEFPERILDDVRSRLRRS